jgi:hypothetical protein
MLKTKGQQRSAAKKALQKNVMLSAAEASLPNDPKGVVEMLRLRSA